MSLPYAVDAEQPLQPSELQVLRDQFLKELEQGHASTQTKFNYAWGLVKSRSREDMAEGVGLLTGEIGYKVKAHQVVEADVAVPFLVRNIQE